LWGICNYWYEILMEIGNAWAHRLECTANRRDQTSHMGATGTSMIRWPFPLLLGLLIFFWAATPTEGAVAQWCIADPQAPDDMLQSALDWVCGYGGADCSKIQPNGDCFLPDIVASHASIAFNSYWQKLKHQGASCYFNSVALVAESDPSHDGCQYEFVAWAPNSHGYGLHWHFFFVRWFCWDLKILYREIYPRLTFSLFSPSRLSLGQANLLGQA